MPAKRKKDNTFSARKKRRKIKLINTRKAYKRQYVLRNLSRAKKKSDCITKKMHRKVQTPANLEKSNTFSARQ